MDKRSDRGQSTRAHILTIAQRLFTELGYNAVSIETVLRESGLSRGALYHHFPSKEALFAAALEEVEIRLMGAARAAALSATNPLDALRAGCSAWLDLTLRDPAVRQIVLADAPGVIGWHAWRALDDRYGLGLLKSALKAGAEAGRVDPGMVDIYAHILLATLVEIALLGARAEKPAEILRAGRDAMEAVLSRCFGVEPGAPWPATASAAS
jgi:AcrR family transcriptional regulator